MAAAAMAGPESAQYAVCIDYSIDQVRISDTLDNNLSLNLEITDKRSPAERFYDHCKSISINGKVVLMTWGRRYPPAR